MSYGKYIIPVIIYLMLFPILLFMLLISPFCLLVSRKYFKNYLISIDQLLGTIFFNDPDETISSRTGKIVLAWQGRDRKWTVAYWLYKFLNKIQPNHCEKSIEKDEGKNSTN